MDFNSRITLWLRHLWVKYRRVILVAFIIWAIIFAINQIVKNKPKTVTLQNTYNPDTAIITDNQASAKTQEKIKSVLENYVSKCNEKNYQEAFDLLTDDCKEFLYDDSVNRFKEYVDKTFANYKIYHYQSFSIVGNYYIYEVSLLDDIGTTGATGDYNKSIEKYTFVKQSDGNFKIATGDFIRKVNLNNKQIEDNNMIVKMLYYYQSYNKIDYVVQIINRTDKYLDIADGTIGSEVTININGEKRNATNLSNAEVLLAPGKSDTYSLIFDKYFDDSKKASQINFNCVRLIENYDSSSLDTSQDAQKYYSFNIDL